MSQANPERSSAGPLDRIWIVRAPVPSASTIAWTLGWLDEEFRPDGITVDWLREETVRNQPVDARQQRATFREGGNISALRDRSLGRRTKVIGLTWIDERQAIMVRPGSGIHQPADLVGKVFALPAALGPNRASVIRGMSLRGIANALSLAHRDLADVHLKEIPAPPIDYSDPQTIPRMWSGLDLVAQGEVDAVYVKGAAAHEAARALGLKVGVDLDVYPSRISRVNNGTPRPIVVEENLIEDHFDVVTRFLHRTLLAADWAANNLEALTPILARETFSGPEGLRAAYRNDFHRALHPSLGAERIGLLRDQEAFMSRAGLIPDRVDVDAWIDDRPLAAAEALRQRSAVA